MTVEQPGQVLITGEGRWGLKTFLRERLCRAVLPALLTSVAGAADLTEATSPIDAATNRLATLMSLKLEDLLRSEVTSVSKRPEEMFGAAAAAFVITGDDIHRSGVRSIAEALRMVPGISVGQIDGNKWAISARGFNDRFAGKLLVLIDGRTVYSPLNGGVFWEVQDYLLEDIERIEVVRGPGGTLWGANAVNGVINIITKSAKDTSGGYLDGGYGTEARGFGGFRYGFKLGEDWYARAYVQYKNQGRFEEGRDGWDLIQGGFRIDRENDQNRFTIQGDFYSGNINHQQVIPSYTPPYLPIVDERFKVEGGNTLVRYRRQFSDESDLEIQAYFDRAERHETAFGNETETYDFSFQHRFALPWRQNLMYGLGYTCVADRFYNQAPLWINYEPARRNLQTFSGFVQDEIGIVENRLKLVLGTKLEHNDFTGWELQPNARLAWTPTERQTIWGAASRAVQVPARSAKDIHVLLPVEPIPAGPGQPFPLFFTGNGGENVASVELIAYELGYRIQPADRLSFDIAGFYNTYRNFNIGTAGTPFFEPNPVPHLTLPINTASGGEGESYGVEISSEWRPQDWWRIRASYSLLQLSLSGLPTGLESTGKDPAHQAGLMSSFDLPGNLSLDLWGRYVGELTTFGVEAYTDFDARLAWKPSKNIELAIVGQNLIQPRRFEFGSNEFDRTIVTAVPRGVYVELSLRF